jgi:hypothetical protein
MPLTRETISLPEARRRPELCSMPKTSLKPHGAFDQLTAGSYKILLKRLERHQDGFRDLLNTLFAQVTGNLRRNHFSDEVVRLESSIFISVLQATTPFHLDPRGHFLQPDRVGEDLSSLRAERAWRG